MMNRDRETDQKKASLAAGLSIGGALLTGFGGLFGGFLATGNAEFVGGGLYLVAAALAFGLTANAVFGR